VEWREERRPIEVDNCARCGGDTHAAALQRVGTPGWYTGAVYPGGGARACALRSIIGAPQLSGRALPPVVTTPATLRHALQRGAGTWQQSWQQQHGGASVVVSRGDLRCLLRGAVCAPKQQL